MLLTLNSDMLKIQDWAYQWKMSLNQDRTKQAQEIIFSRKKNATTYPTPFFNNSEIKLSSNRKYLGLTLIIKFIRQTKVLVSFENCKQFYHVTTYWLFINRS